MPGALSSSCPLRNAGWISAMRGSSRCETNTPSASTTIQARSQAQAGRLQLGPGSRMPAQDLTG